MDLCGSDTMLAAVHVDKHIYFGRLGRLDTVRWGAGEAQNIEKVRRMCRYESVL